MISIIYTIILMFIVQLKGSRLLQQVASTGSCPDSKGLIGICVERCDNCAANGQLCCSNGCGHVCMDPVFPTSDCSAVTCLLPVCQVGEELVTPEGECCSVCQQPGPAVGCGIDNCNSYNNGCNVCSCRDNGLEMCTLRFCSEEETGEPFCTGCEDGYTLNELTKKCDILCESNSDCDRMNGYRCRNDPLCGRKEAENGRCTQKDVCLKADGRCASEADCQSGYICVGRRNRRTGFCVDYQ